MNIFASEVVYSFVFIHCRSRHPIWKALSLFAACFVALMTHLYWLNSGLRKFLPASWYEKFNFPVIPRNRCLESFVTRKQVHLYQPLASQIKRNVQSRFLPTNYSIKLVASKVFVSALHIVRQHHVVTMIVINFWFFKQLYTTWSDTLLRWEVNPYIL